MNDEARNAMRERLRKGAEQLSRSLSFGSLENLPGNLHHFYRLSGREGTVYLLLPEPPTSDCAAWLESAGAQKWLPPGDPAPALLREYLLGLSREEAATERFTLSAGKGEPEVSGYLLYRSDGEKNTLTTEIPADLLAGRALLDEALLEAESGTSWLLARCERIGYASVGEATKLLGAAPATPVYKEPAKKALLSESALQSLSEKSAGRLMKLIPEVITKRRPGASSDGCLLFLFRVTRGEAAGTLQSSRLLFAAPIHAKTKLGQNRFREVIFILLSAQSANDKEAGLSWLRLLAPRRYQYLRPSAGRSFLYNSLVSLDGDGVQRAFAELRREASAFRALGMVIATAPEFHASLLRKALSPSQRELLLPRHPPRSGEYSGRLTALLEALGTIEAYAENNPATAARPGMELFQRVARERYRRIRARIDASVTAGVYALLFEHAGLSRLQRAWSRIPRREMVRALAFEPPRIVERAGQLYSRRGRALLREDAEALARRAEEWEPAQVTYIHAARRRLWPILMDRLFDGESLERYVGAVTEAVEKGGFPAAVAALTLLRVEELRPGSVGPKLLVTAAARVAAEPRLDGESEARLATIAEDPRLLREGGSRFAWLLAHALERMGRPEAAADALKLVLRRLAAKEGELPPEEQRRARRLGRKYRDLTT